MKNTDRTMEIIDFLGKAIRSNVTGVICVLGTELTADDWISFVIEQRKKPKNMLFFNLKNVDETLIELEDMLVKMEEKTYLKTKKLVLKEYPLEAYFEIIDEIRYDNEHPKEAEEKWEKFRTLLRKAYDEGREEEILNAISNAKKNRIARIMEWF